jgi:hypothetical protein
VAHDQHPARVAAVRRDVLVNPTQRARDVAGDGAHIDDRQQAVVDGDEHEARVHEGLRFEGHHALVARLPAAAVNPEHHRQVLRGGGRVHIEHLPGVSRGVGHIPGDLLSVRNGYARGGPDSNAQNADQVFHRVK